jgi:serine phosphatase RsbU (regulator of sigma subunit)
MAAHAHAHAHRPTATDDRWRLQIATAGHPPLALRTPDGEVRLLDEARGLILGVDPTSDRASKTVWTARGSVLIAYTDGLIERRHQDLDQGLARLTATLTAQPVTATAHDLCTALTALVDQPDDDVAIIAVQLL